MARHEPDIRAAGEGPLTLQELLTLLGEAKAAAEGERHEAIACCLSASEGWDEAAQRLGGTFAGEGKGLTDRKAD